MTYPVYQRGFRKLIAWQEARKLTLLIYQTTSKFPAFELYGISDQLRRAACSTQAQLAEGSQMKTVGHKRLFYRRAYGSNGEVDNFAELAKDLGYMDEKIYLSILELINKVGFLIQKLIDSLPTKKKMPTYPTYPTQPTYQVIRQASHNHAQGAAH